MSYITHSIPEYIDIEISNEQTELLKSIFDLVPLHREHILPREVFSKMGYSREESESLLGQLRYNNLNGYNPLVIKTQHYVVEYLAINDEGQLSWTRDKNSAICIPSNCVIVD